MPRLPVLVAVSAALVALAVGTATSVGGKADRPEQGFGLYEVRAASQPDEVFVLRKRPTEATGFLRLQRQPDSAPVRWDSCRAIHWVYNPENAPAGGFKEVYRAFQIASKSTGFLFVYDGATSERSDQFPDRSYLPDLYGDRWSPVLVTWQHTMTSEDGTTVYATAGPKAVTRPSGGLAYVTGEVRLNAEAFDGWINAETATREKEQGTLLHEIGHLLGLGHSDDPTSLMYPHVLAKVSTYTSKDVKALRVLSDGPCLTDL